MKLRKIPTYLIQKWLFEDAKDNFEIDLGESGVQHQYLNKVNFDSKQHMNYITDAGSDDLRDILASYYGCSKNNICITHGGQEALYLFYRSFLEKGDHVITFSPGWSQSWVIPKEVGCDVSIIKLKSQHGFKLDIDELKRHITPQTKLIVINYPNNPTGVKLDQDEYNHLIKICNEHNIFLLNDEEYLYDYEDSIFKKSNYAASIGSISKIYGFPATRIGWIVSSTEVIEQVINYKRYVTVCNSSLCESLASDILQRKDEHIKRYKTLVTKGLEVLKEWSKRNPDINLIEPNETPYAYVVLPKEWDSDEFCRTLLYQKKVLLMPASVFLHDENAFRITFARELELLTEGLNRIQEHITYYKEKVAL